MQLATIENETEIVNTVEELCGKANELVIMTPRDMVDATDLVKVIKTRAKVFDDERVKLVKPLNGVVDDINARFKVMLRPLADAEAQIKKEMLAFQQAEARKAEAARKEAERIAAEEAAAAAESRPEAPPPPAADIAAPEQRQTVYGATGSVSTVRRVWTFEVIDKAALAAARADLVQIDTAKVNAEIRGKGGEIPGLRIYQQETIAIR